jgi:hypothetical protein
MLGPLEDTLAQSNRLLAEYCERLEVAHHRQDLYLRPPFVLASGVGPGTGARALLDRRMWLERLAPNLARRTRRLRFGRAVVRRVHMMPLQDHVHPQGLQSSQSSQRDGSQHGPGTGDSQLSANPDLQHAAWQI